MRWFILDNLSSRFKEGERRGVRFGKRERKERRSKKNRLRLIFLFLYVYIYIYLSLFSVRSLFPCFSKNRGTEDAVSVFKKGRKERVDIFREFMNAKKKRESCYSLFSLQHSSQTFSPISLCVYTWLIYPRFHCDLFFRGEKSIEE